MLTVASTIKQSPTIDADVIVSAILGKHYDATLVYIGEQRARTLNQTTRNKDYVPNVLSFPLTDTAGEIYICPAVAAREAHRFELSIDGYLRYLIIHGALHLKGYDHGPEMDALEERYKTKFSIH